MFPVIQVGPLAIQSSWLILLVSFYLTTVIIEKAAKTENMEEGKVDNVILFSTAAGLLGARFGFVLQHLDLFADNWGSIFSINGSMLDLPSGLLFAIITGAVLLQKYNIPLLNFLDTVSWGACLFFTGVLLSAFASGNYPGTATDLPWGMEFAGAVRHPVQIYEVALIVGLLAVLWFLKRKGVVVLPTGGLFFTAAAIVSGVMLLLNIFLESGDLIIGVRSSQLATWGILTLALVLLEWRFRIGNKNGLNGG